MTPRHISADTLARLDEQRLIIRELLDLCTRREEILASHTRQLREPPTVGADAVAPKDGRGSGGALALRHALKEHPNYLAATSLLAPPPGSQRLEPDREQAFQRLAQLDEAIAQLEVIAAAGLAAGSSAGGAPAGGSSSTFTAGSADTDAAQAPRLGMRLDRFRTIGGADAELEAGLRVAASGVRRALDGGDDEIASCMLDAGSTLARPFLSLPARKRMRRSRDEAADGAWPMPIGATGAVPAPRLLRGDVLHVPFTAAEVRLFQRLLAEHGVPPTAAPAAPAAPAANATAAAESGSSAAGSAPPPSPSPPPAAVLQLTSARLPGRTPLDCLRFWQSGEGAAGAAGGGGRGGAGRRSDDDEGGAEQLMVRSAAPTGTQLPSASAAAPRRAPPRLRAASVAPVGGIAASALWRRTHHPAKQLLEWRCGGGGPRGMLHGAAAASQLWRALRQGYAPSSVCSQPTGNVTDLAFSPSLGGSPRLVVGSTLEPNELLLFDLARGSSRVLGGGGGAGHATTVSCVRFCCDGSAVLSASYDRTVRMWSADDGALMRVLGHPVLPQPPEPNAGAAAGGAGAGAGAIAAGGGGGGGGGGSADDDDEAEPGVGGEIDPGQRAADTPLAPGEGISQLSEEEAAMVAAAAAQVAAEDARDAPTWEYRADQPGHADHVVCLAAHPSRPRLAASGGKDSTLILWDLEGGKPLTRLQMPTMPLDLTFGHAAHEGSLFVALDTHAAGGGGGRLCAFDVATARELYSLPQAKGHVSCLHASRSGDAFLLGAADGVVRMHRARDGAQQFSFASGMSDVNLVSLSCDELYVQASGDKDLTYVLDVRRPEQPLHVLPHERPNAPSGQHVNGVSAQWCHRSRTTLVTGSDDAVVRIWDVSLGEPLQARMEAHTSPVSCVGISPEDEVIASGGDEGKVVLYSRASHGGEEPGKPRAASGYSVGSEDDVLLGR